MIPSFDETINVIFVPMCVAGQCGSWCQGVRVPSSGPGHITHCWSGSWSLRPHIPYLIVFLNLNTLLVTCQLSPATWSVAQCQCSGHQVPGHSGPFCCQNLHNTAIIRCCCLFRRNHCCQIFTIPANRDWLTVEPCLMQQ